MKRSTFSEERIVYGLRQAENGTSVADVCRAAGADATNASTHSVADARQKA